MAGTGLLGHYTSNAISGTRVDPTINFIFTGTSPGFGIPSDTAFDIRWTGTLIPLYNEHYTFTAVSDNGSVLRLGGTVIFTSAPNDVGPFSGSIDLVAGVPITVVYDYHSDGVAAAYAELYWQSASQAYQVVPQSQLYPPPPIAPTLTGFGLVINGVPAIALQGY